MSTKTILGAVLAGVALFFWGFLSHMVIGLGHTGLAEMPGDPAIVSTLRAHVNAPGVYYFPPGAEAIESATGAERERLESEYVEQLKVGPSGLLVVAPKRDSYLDPSMFLNEIALDVFLALFTAWLLCALADRITSITGRVLFAAALGFVGAVSVHFQEWNWYGFPGDFIGAQVVDQTLGAAIVGLVLTFFLPRRSA